VPLRPNALRAFSIKQVANATLKARKRWAQAPPVFFLSHIFDM
jgi:hypothetical protein